VVNSDPVCQDPNHNRHDGTTRNRHNHDSGTFSGERPPGAAIPTANVDSSGVLCLCRALTVRFRSTKSEEQDVDVAESWNDQGVVDPLTPAGFPLGHCRIMATVD
jgi:hypothetical protein